MMYKFNGGRGAVICDQCKVMIDEGLGLKEYEEIYGKSGHDGDFCPLCKNGIQREPKKDKSGIIDLIDGWRN